MPSFEAKIDANFYGLIHRLAVPPQDGPQEDRRHRSRYPFSVIQKIAPYSGARFPADGDFFDVCCHDLTRSGFSFLLPTPPGFTCLVARFGSPPDEIYVAAEVAHCARVLWHPSGKVKPAGERSLHGRQQGAELAAAVPMTLVGCRFLRRMRKPPAPAG